MWVAAFSVVAARADGPLDPADFAPIAASYEAAGVTIDTDTLTFGPHPGVVHDGIAVFAFGSLVLSGRVSVVGARPVALLTTGDLVVEGTLDASGDGRTGGPGGFDAITGEDGGGPGGGAAYDVGTGGGFCGDGGDADDGQRPGGTAYGDLQRTLEGGSAGGSSTDGNGGDGGGGGGAIELGALGVLVVAGEVVARGGDAEAVDKYGGGGGAGGGVLLHGGLGSRCTGTIAVDGGDGGDSAEDKGGGGGGGGCVVLFGLAADGCTIAAEGGPGGEGSADAESGETSTASAVVDPNPDLDGDGFTLEDGDCNDLDGSVNPDATGDDGCVDPPDPPVDTGEPVDPTPDDTAAPDTDAPVDPADPPGSVDGPGLDPAPWAPGYALCGCASPGTAAGWPGLGALLLVVRGRRRAHGRTP